MKYQPLPTRPNQFVPQFYTQEQIEARVAVLNTELTPERSDFNLRCLRALRRKYQLNTGNK
jgi:hypothetical protein